MADGSLSARQSPLKSLLAHKWRALKLALSIALIAFAARGLLRQFVFLRAEFAVVTPKVVTVRTPIEGNVSLSGVKEGEIVPDGAKLAEVRDVRADDTELSRVNAQLSSVAGAIESLTSSTRELEAVASSLKSRGAAFRNSQVQQLVSNISRAAASEASEAAKLMAAEARRQRVSEMAQQGLASSEQLEQAERDAVVATKSLEVARQDLALYQRRAESARQDVMLDTSSAADRPYSSQRLDEVSLQLIGNRKQLSDLQAQQAALSAELQRLQQRHALLTSAMISAPSKARVWRVLRTSNAYVTKGEAIYVLQNCTDVKVVATVTERVLNRIRVGTPANFLTETGARFRGRVVGLSASEQLPKQDQLELLPGLLPSPQQAGAIAAYQVLVAFPELSRSVMRDCDFGVTGELTFDGSSSGQL